MPTITEGRLIFDFPDGWRAQKFDDWSFYRNQFIKCGDARTTCSKCKNPVAAGSKAIDVLAIDMNSCCWSIEIKDYRLHQRVKVIDLADEVALKVRDSLAVLVASRVNANDSDEKAMANAALQCSRLRVVLHLEQPAKHSKLFPRAIDPTNVQQRLKQLIKAIDPHPRVVDMGGMNGLAWSVHNHQ